MDWAAGISREWVMAVICGFPLLLLLVNELLNRAAKHGSPLAPSLRSVRNLLLPAAVVAAMILLVLSLPKDHTASRVALSLLWIAVFAAILQFINDVVFGAAKPGSWRANVPACSGTSCVP